MTHRFIFALVLVSCGGDFSTGFHPGEPTGGGAGEPPDAGMNATGGAHATGGTGGVTPPVTGGADNTGGLMDTGGAGHDTGGTAPTGGAPTVDAGATGGTLGSGGSGGTGGVTPTGGTGGEDPCLFGLCCQGTPCDAPCGAVTGGHCCLPSPLTGCGCLEKPAGCSGICGVFVCK
jgi:hypothetical protein